MNNENTFLGFFNLDKSEWKKIAKRSVILCGFPYEGEKETPKGAKDSPNIIRDYSTYTSGVSCSFDIAKTLQEYYDIGNIDLSSTESLDDLKELWNIVYSTGSILIALGGDHLVSYFPLKTANICKDSAVIWLDAHADLADEYPENVFRSHATVFNNLIKEGKVNPKHMLLIGGHAFTQSPYEYDMIQTNEVNYISTEEIIENKEEAMKKVKAFVSDFNKIYLSIDLDILDQSYAPTLSVPEPFGLSPYQLTELVKVFLPKIQYIDIVETRITEEDKSVLRIVTALLFKILESLSKQQ